MALVTDSFCHIIHINHLIDSVVGTRVTSIPYMSSDFLPPARKLVTTFLIMYIIYIFQYIVRVTSIVMSSNEKERVSPLASIQQIQYVMRMSDDWKNFEPRKNAPGIAPKPETIAAPVDINDQGALKALAMEALVEIVQKAPRNVSLVGAIRELIDRIEGKAPQSIAMTVKADPVSKLTDDQLALLLANCPNPMILPPMPKKLDID